MKLYNFTATFSETTESYTKEFESDDLQECKAWLVKQLAKNNAPDGMSLYDNVRDKCLLSEFNNFSTN